MKQENSALVKSNYDELPREAKKTKDDTFERIHKYYHNERTKVVLSDEEVRIRERWEKAWLLLCRHRTKKQVVELIEKLFNVEKSVAYDDVKKAMMLFSDPQTDLKDAKRAIAEDAYLKGADKAWKSGQLELHLKYMKEYATINKLNIEDGGINGIEDLIKKLKPTVINITLSKDQLHNEATKLQEELTKDVDFIEISNEDEGSED